MRRFLLALLCAAPLAAGTPAVEEPIVAQPQGLPVAVETVRLTSMGCNAVDCVDPTHYHSCPADCTDPAHYHSCPVGCADPTHPHCNQCWETAPEVGPGFWASMGCNLTDCADPAHYHHCPAGCTDPAHYHDCPLGCADPTHPCCGRYLTADGDTVSAFCGSMGCSWTGCTDPAHYHHCPAGCTDPAHCHDQPLGGQNQAYSYNGHHGGGWGHHGRGHH